VVPFFPPIKNKNLPPPGAGEVSRGSTQFRLRYDAGISFGF
jgi:hypothetical protein